MSAPPQVLPCWLPAPACLLLWAGAMGDASQGRPGARGSPMLLPWARACRRRQQRPLTHDLMKNIVGGGRHGMHTATCLLLPCTLHRRHASPHCLLTPPPPLGFFAAPRCAALGYTVTQVRITEIIANTYYARIHITRPDPAGGPDPDARDIDARPSDAINLAVRCGAPM